MQAKNIYVEKALDYIFGALFDEKTHIIFDGRTALTPDGNTRALPCLGEIRAGIPNPCAWNAGMENGAMNNGTTLDALTMRYLLTGEKDARIAGLIKGIDLMSTASGIRGFLARSVSPVDGKTCFSDSSRDQYTHVIYAVCRYLDSGAATAEERRILSDHIVAYAEYAEKCVRPENGYRIERTDGAGGAVMGMWGKQLPHEMLRLPMFYIAAYHVSGDEHWLDLYKKYRDEGIEKSQITTKYMSRAFGYEQMQYSVRLCHDYDPDEEYRRRYKALGASIADYTRMYVKERSVTDNVFSAVAEGRKFDTLCCEWRTAPHDYDAGLGKAIGYVPGYFIPRRNEDFESDLWTLWEIASSVIAVAISPSGNDVPDPMVDALTAALAAIDYDRHATEAPCRLVAAYYDLLALGKVE